MGRLGLVLALIVSLGACSHEETRECQEWQESYMRAKQDFPAFLPSYLERRPDDCDIP